MNVCLEAPNGHVHVQSAAGELVTDGISVCCSSAGWVGITLLNVAFMVMTIADARRWCSHDDYQHRGARACCGGSNVSRDAMAGGLIAIAGLLLVTQPEAIFGGSAPPLAGVLLCFGAAQCWAPSTLYPRRTCKEQARGNVRLTRHAAVLLYGHSWRGLALSL